MSSTSRQTPLRKRKYSWIKQTLTRLGAHLSQKTVYNLNSAISHIETGRWFHAHGYNTSRRLDYREQLFDLVAEQVGDKKVLYLEFGVYRGQATEYWCKILRNRQSSLHGFDSFEGLPEDWIPELTKGHFSLDGAIPKINDPRVQFFKGWFEETLPHYTFPQHEVLVLNCDADLYSSTSFVLNSLETAIVPGSYVYFDEFANQMHELRAFDEFITRTKMRFTVLGVTRTLQHALFRRVS